MLFSAEEVSRRVAELAQAIQRDWGGGELVAVGVLKGSFVFLADLIRHLSLPVKVDFLAAASYGRATVSSGVVRLLKDLDLPVVGKDVLLVEDIVDTGLTLNYLVDLIRSKGARTVKVCALLDKRERRQVPVEIHYCGFVVPDVFVVGYGLDYAERFRELPYIGCLEGVKESGPPGAK